MRKYYLDNIRWIVQVLVVIYHVCFMYNGLGFPATVGVIGAGQPMVTDVYQYAVYPWFMTVLFMVAGMSARLYLDRHTHKEFIKNRTTRLLVPSTVGLVAFQFIQGYINMALSENRFGSLEGIPAVVRFLILAVSGTGVLWFLQVLWVLSMLLVLIRKVEKDRLWEKCRGLDLPVLMLFTVAVWCAAQILNTPFIAVYRFGLYGTAYLMGYFIFSHDEVMERLKSAWYVFAVSALACGIAFTVRYFGQNYADAPFNRTMLYCFFAYLMSVAVLGFRARYLDFTSSFSSWMAKKSFGLYVFHYLGISAVGLFIAKPKILPARAIYALSLLAGFGGALLLNEVISGLPFFRWAVLGIRKERN